MRCDMQQILNILEFLQFDRNFIFFAARRVGRSHGMMEEYNVGMPGMKSGKGSIAEELHNFVKTDHETGRSN
jgi:hypothetical protein